MTAQRCLAVREVSNREQKLVLRLILESSAPEDRPHPPAVAIRAAGPQLDLDVARTRVMVSEIHRTIVQGQEGTVSARPRSVKKPQGDPLSYI